MARSRINSKSKDLIKDNGSVLVSVVEGEQIHMGVTLGWLTNLSGYTITAKIVEADSSSLVHTDETSLPLNLQAGGQVTTLPIIDADVTDNTFNIVIPEDLVSLYVTQPSPEKPAYGWIGVEVADTGVGNAQQIWKPMRGLVEILYSPSEEV
jgi:hypothetical protein